MSGGTPELNAAGVAKGTGGAGATFAADAAGGSVLTGGKPVFYGFAPVIDKNSRLLILGSFPSVKSREVGFYYGNPQNRFWKTLEKATGESVPPTPKLKTEYLLKHKIALWDVIERCAISGSSDADITGDNSQAADILSVLTIPEKLAAVICNGKKAYSVCTEVCRGQDVPIIYLSSTSPANPRFLESEWIRVIKKYLTE